VLGIVAKISFVILHFILALFNRPRERYELEELDLKDIDDEHERFNKIAIDSLIKRLKDEFNFQKKDEKFMIEI